MSVLLTALAAGAMLTWTAVDGTVSTERVALCDKSPDVEILSLDRDRIISKGAKRLDIVPDFACAAKGEKGFWFTPYGVYGEYDCDNGSYFTEAERTGMPMFGWSNDGGAYLAIVTSLKYFVRETVTVKDGRYSVAATLEEQLCREPYEDLVIEYHKRPAGTSYAELAAIYRKYQLDNGVVRPFRERFKENPVLEKAIMAPEIRIRQAWKPVPSPVLHQTPENEPPVRIAVTFDRVKEIVDEMKRQGIEDAELCLVGWNIGGHDGRWPQYFPSEPGLGGDEKLKTAIKHALESGYLIVPHGNFHEGYTVADNFDGEMTIKDADGLMLPTRGGTVSWGGGRPYHICPQRAYENICAVEIPRLAAFGFKGIGYFDVVTICEPQPCHDPRHPCSAADGAKYWGACAALSQRDLGGFASESCNDYFAGNFDYCLYAYFGDPREIESAHAAGTGIAKRVVPIWQIVYNGIIANNPFTITMNPTVKDRYSQLKDIEFSARPSFYIYSKFVDEGDNWMGQEDLRCETDDQLRWSVSKIKEGCDRYSALRHLQLEFIEDHCVAAPGVTCTSYSNGEKVYVNYNGRPVRVEGVKIPAMDYVLVGN